MTKIVYNAQHGGFGLSKEAAELMAARGHKEAQAELDAWAVRDEAVQHFLKTGEWLDSVKDSASFLAIDAKYRKAAQWYGHFSELDRSDPLLVEAVESLGDRANGEYARLKIAEVPSGTKYRIDEYDGSEAVMTVDDYEWQTAS